MNTDFETISTLQYRNRSQARLIDAFESGEKYVQMDEAYRKMVCFHNREVKKLELKIAKAHAETVTVRKYWSEVMDDLDKEHQKEIRQLLAEIERMKKYIDTIIQQRDRAYDKLHERTIEYYDVAGQLETEKEKSQKLTAQLNKDFENSSIPSSMQVVHKKIPNSREKSDKKQGGQPGHKGHSRKQHLPTERCEIPAPAKYAQNPEYRPTGKEIRKQKIILHATVEVIEYFTKEYRNLKTGQRVHADFPDGYMNEVNYDGSVKAFAFLLGNECNVSHDKVKKFISEITNGELELSKGMLNHLCKEFASKTQEEQQIAYETLMNSPVMNTDFTNANVNGESAQVLICAEPVTETVLFFAREKKGHVGIKGSPVETYMGTLVHDHDTTFYKYGTNHQECMQHNGRYLKGSEQNEPAFAWNIQMHELIREMLHYRNHLENLELDPNIVGNFEERYDEILLTAENEYLDSPPSDYYREGYNLYLRLIKYKENQLLFLHDKRVPTNNSLCERMARVYKRKQKQAMVMRSFDSFKNLCISMGMVQFLRHKEGNTYQQISDIFERK